MASISIGTGVAGKVQFKSSFGGGPVREDGLYLFDITKLEEKVTSKGNNAVYAEFKVVDEDEKGKVIKRTIAADGEAKGTDFGNIEFFLQFVGAVLSGGGLSKDEVQEQLAEMEGSEFDLGAWCTRVMSSGTPRCYGQISTRIKTHTETGRSYPASDISRFVLKEDVENAARKRWPHSMEVQRFRDGHEGNTMPADGAEADEARSVV